jgi:hypothetical protein
MMVEECEEKMTLEASLCRVLILGGGRAGWAWTCMLGNLSFRPCIVGMHRGGIVWRPHRHVRAIDVGWCSGYVDFTRFALA